jgi:hypothetical protein
MPISATQFNRPVNGWGRQENRRRKRGNECPGCAERRLQAVSEIMSKNQIKMRLIPYYRYSAYHHKNIHSEVNNRFRDQTTLLFNVTVIQPIAPTIRDYLYRLRPTE